ncbi:MAG: DUF1573 domain-containing protein [Pirellulaceae bacterium]
MRLSVVVVLIVILGGSLGVAHTWSEFAGVEERMALPEGVLADESGTIADVATTNRESTATIGTPRASVVGEPSNDFGVLKRDASKSHSFVIRNDGDADLLLEKQNVSCGLCVQTTFTSATVKPGEEFTIPVSLAARKPGPALSETLEVRTNDKAHEVIRFDLIGYISEVAGASVHELAMGTVSTDEGATGRFRVYGFAKEPLEIIECKLADRDNQDYFDLEVDDLSQEDVKAGQSHANFGKEITLKVKPGLPVGPLDQSVKVVARAGEEVTIDVPISGRVTGPLSLIGGSAFSPDKSLLSLGRVLAGEGVSAKLHLMVKGEHRDDVELAVCECEPGEYLSATIGERKAIRDGQAYLFPITVEIDKNAPSQNRLGGVGNPVGKIRLRTTHPTAKEVTLFVRFAVE